MKRTIVVVVCSLGSLLQQSKLSAYLKKSSPMTGAGAAH